MIDKHVIVSSESENEKDKGGCSLEDGISDWSNECQVKQSTVDKLLKVLRQHGHVDL